MGLEGCCWAGGREGEQLTVLNAKHLRRGLREAAVPGLHGAEGLRD